MDPGQVLELVDWGLGLWNPKFVFQLPRGGNSHTKLVFLDLLFLEIVQGMRTACVRPHVWESNLLRRTLLEKQPCI